MLSETNKAGFRRLFYLCAQYKFCMHRQLNLTPYFNSEELFALSRKLDSRERDNFG
jgi:hypothetical protein